MSKEFRPDNARSRWSGLNVELWAGLLSSLVFMLVFGAALAFGGWWWSGIGLMLLLCFLFLVLEAMNHLRRFRSAWIALEATPEFGSLFQAIRFMLRELLSAFGLIVFGVFMIGAGIAVALFIYSSRPVLA